MEAFLSVALGLGLSAACGFRVFVPLLVMSAAANGGFLELSQRFDWIASTPALIAFAAATLLEVGAYYVPWLDNALDSVASPVAVVAGVLVTASVVTGMDPFLKWTLAVIAGGGIAGSVQALTTSTRGASLLATAGLGNPIVSTVEVGGSLVVAVLAVLMPVAALVLVLCVLWFAWSRLRRRRAPACDQRMPA